MGRVFVLSALLLGAVFISTPAKAHYGVGYRGPVYAGVANWNHAYYWAPYAAYGYYPYWNSSYTPYYTPPYFSYTDPAWQWGPGLYQNYLDQQYSNQLYQRHLANRRRMMAEKAAKIQKETNAPPVPQPPEENVAPQPFHYEIPILTDAQFNRKTGQLVWPVALQSDAFKDARMVLENLFQERAARPKDVGPDSKNTEEVRAAVSGVSDMLHSQIGEMGAKEYMQARHFLDSMLAEARVIPQ